MKVVLDWPRRLRWCARLDRLILSAIVLSLLSVVSAAQTSGTCECDKTRELVTTVWGGAVTILVLSFDTWSTVKQFTDASASRKVAQRVIFFIWGVLNPVLVLFMIVEFAAWRYYTRRRMRGFKVLSLLSPWTRDPAKIVSGCQVVISVPTVISIPENFTETGLPSLSEAVVIGSGLEESQDTRNIRLGDTGKEVLLQMEGILPPYDQLRVLQGSSGLATFISAVQSVGYIYGVVVRTAQGLPVSPIEVVALTLSIQILTKALLHNFVSTCHRPLHVYLTHNQAHTFVTQCEHYTAHEDPGSRAVGPFVVIVVLVSGVAIYYIIHMWQTTRRIMVVPIMLTLVGLNLQLVTIWAYTKMYRTIMGCTLTICAMVNVTSYIFALVITIKYWEVDRLNVKASSMIAQILPYIGV